MNRGSGFATLLAIRYSLFASFEHIYVFQRSDVLMDIDNESDQADRTISTSKLRALLRFHTWPINVMVFHGPQGYLVSRRVSRLDAFSGYLFST